MIARVILAVALLGAAAARADEAAPSPPAPPAVTVESIRVERSGTPGPLAADTLCRLHVTLRNAGAAKASALAFRVKVAGEELPVYRNQLFYHLLAPETTSELRLYNFWTTETGRSLPANGKLTIEVALTEAAWMQVEMDAGVEVWTPLEPVAGLPSIASMVVDLTATGAAQAAEDDPGAGEAPAQR